MENKGRRGFLKTVAGGAALLPQAANAQLPAASGSAAVPAAPGGAAARPQVQYPRAFTGRQLAMIAFPLGGICAGSLSLGGRGQLRDWEIFNRPDKGNAPSFALPCIWAQAGTDKPVARVLEARYLPPYEGSSGLGALNAPGLVRLASARFTGEYPLARIDFQDRRLPVKVALEAFSPFIPHDADDSGLPVAVLRYRVSNPGAQPAKVSIAWCIDNPVGGTAQTGIRPPEDSRKNEHRRGGLLEGLVMANPGLAKDHALSGNFALALAGAGDGKVTHWRGWPRSRWFNSPMLFWDDFSADGELGAEPDPMNAIGSLCLTRTVPAGQEAEYTFLLAWHFPNRTPARCGWSAPKGEANTLIGNFYCTRFPDAWAAAEYAAQNLPALEKKTRQFAAAMRETTLPGALKDAASANLSTLASTTCFRIANGEFYGFEGVNDKSGCCFGNCTHVWNYETATSHLFPAMARSFRRASFGYSMDDAGAIHFRTLLPEGQARSGFAAADGQMGQIMHAYLDWRLSGDREWLNAIWPRVKKALEFSWVPGGWDGDRDGVMEGVQHNTYDVEFFGPNPQCGVYYLGGLRAGEELARAAGDEAAAREYRRLFESGRKWIDANLFNGEYYIQKVQGIPKDRIAPALRSDMGSDDTEKPEYQMGEGCLVDQLIGQYLADICGLGPLLEEKNIRQTLESINRYNRRTELTEHFSVQRTYALNDEAAVVICDYGKAPRPRIPFPYYAEAWTGLEYLVAAQFLFAGMAREGVEVVAGARLRHDGERRNPWNEPECGHHYARALSAWSAFLAASGFRYDGARETASVEPRMNAAAFRGFWSSATGWGLFTRARKAAATEVTLRLDHGSLALRGCEIAAPGTVVSATLDGKAVPVKVERRGATAVLSFADRLLLREGTLLSVSVRA